MKSYGLNSSTDASAATAPPTGQRQKLDVQRWHQEMERFVDEVSSELTSIAELVDAIEEAPAQGQAVVPAPESISTLPPELTPLNSDNNDRDKPRDAKLSLTEIAHPAGSDEGVTDRTCQATSDAPVVPDCVPGNRLRSIQERLQNLGSPEPAQPKSPTDRESGND